MIVGKGKLSMNRQEWQSRFKSACMHIWKDIVKRKIGAVRCNQPVFNQNEGCRNKNFMIIISNNVISAM